MAQEVHNFQVTVAANTPIAAPQMTALAMPPRKVTGIEIIVPPGPRGVLGFALGYGGNPVYPYESGGYFVTDDEKISWPIDDPMTSGAWELFAYNTGVYPHTLEIRFLCDLPDASSPAAPMLPADQLQPAPAPVVAPASSAVSDLSSLDPATIALGQLGAIDLPPIPPPPD